MIRLLAIALLFGAPLSAQVRPSADPDCGSQRLASLVLGDALDKLRGARLFAEDRERRKALAELEILIVEQIQSETDSLFRQAAWMQADNAVSLEMAKKRREQIERIASRYPADGPSFRLEEFAREYRSIMADVVKLLDPRTPRRCASARWLPLHAAALRAEAL